MMSPMASLDFWITSMSCRIYDLLNYALMPKRTTTGVEQSMYIRNDPKSQYQRL